MADKIKKIKNWITHNSKLVIFFIMSFFFIVFVLWWGYKNKKINSMRNQIAILESKLKLEKLAMKYDINLSEIKAITAKEKEVEKEINKIKTELNIKLSSSMSVEEIAQTFKEIGVFVDVD